MVMLKRVADVQHELWRISEECDIEGPSVGDDLWKHIYREANTYADELTWHARNGTCNLFFGQQLVLSNRDNIKYIRGCWDGGVSEKGAAGGFWIEVSSESSPWVLAFSQAYLIGSASVTEAELSAAERLSRGVAQIIRDIGPSQKRRRQYL